MFGYENKLLFYEGREKIIMVGKYCKCDEVYYFLSGML